MKYREIIPFQWDDDVLERFEMIILGWLCGSISRIFLLIVVFISNNISNKRFIVNHNGREIDFVENISKILALFHWKYLYNILCDLSYLRKIIRVYLKHCVSLFLTIYFNISQ